jgi:hypothetical protein
VGGGSAFLDMQLFRETCCGPWRLRCWDEQYHIQAAKRTLTLHMFFKFVWGSDGLLKNNLCQDVS